MNIKKMTNFRHIKVYICISFFLLSGCKGDIEPIPVPITNNQQNVPCQNLTFYGFPENKNSVETQNFFICREGYALNFNPVRKTSQWVVEKTGQDILKKPQQALKIDDTRPDPQLSKKAQSQKNDYVGIGYKKIELASPENMLSNDVLYSYTHYLSNAVPIYPDNYTTWKNLENYVRQIGLQHKVIYIITGTVYANGNGLGWVGVPDSISNSAKTSNNGKIEVPSYLYKLVLIPEIHKSIGFIIPNDKPSSVMVISPSELEQLSQMHFSPDLTEQERQKLLGF